MMVGGVKWNPISENLPAESGNYLVTTLTTYSGGYSTKEIKVAFWFKQPKEWFIHEVDECIPGEVIAWSELPSVYNG